MKTCATRNTHGAVIGVKFVSTDLVNAVMLFCLIAAMLLGGFMTYDKAKYGDAYRVLDSQVVGQAVQLTYTLKDQDGALVRKVVTLDDSYNKLDRIQKHYVQDKLSDQFHRQGLETVKVDVKKGV